MLAKKLFGVTVTVDPARPVVTQDEIGLAVSQLSQPEYVDVANVINASFAVLENNYSLSLRN